MLKNYCRKYPLVLKINNNNNNRTTFESSPIHGCDLGSSKSYTISCYEISRNDIRDEYKVTEQSQ